MQSLWGCAYEMRSLGDVNYKITQENTVLSLLLILLLLYRSLLSMGTVDYFKNPL
jgi:hypothetical protein